MGAQYLLIDEKVSKPVKERMKTSKPTLPVLLALPSSSLPNAGVQAVILIMLPKPMLSFLLTSAASNDL